MRRLSSLIAVLSLAAVSFAAACRSDSNNSPTDGQGSGSGSGSGSTTTVKDIQSESMVPGTAVTLNNVVVTAVDTFGDKTGDMWVEDIGGGKRSGVHVFKGTVASGTVSVGDVVNITGGIKAEFALTGSNADNTGRTTTELEPASSSSTMTVTKTGATATITPDKVDALAIGQMYDGTMSALGGGSAFSNAWEDWEGVLVELDNVAAASAAKTFSKATPTPADSFALKITGVAKMEGTMTDISMIPYGACFGQLTGVVDYFYDYLVLPRTAADFNTTGTACPAAETSCADNIDNDGNGFTDCADNGCVVASASCRSATTIHALDVAADAAPTAPVLPASVSLTGVCVTAVSNNNMYVADSGTAAAAGDGGIYAFGGGSALPTGVVAGTTVDVIGNTSLFKKPSSTAPEPQVEIQALQVTKDAASCTVLPATPNLTAAQLTADATGHKWIGSPITINGTGPTGQFKITTAQSAMSSFGKLTQNGTAFSYGWTFLTGYDMNDTTKCYNSITGIWTYDTTGAGSYEILPTVIPTAVTCL